MAGHRDTFFRPLRFIRTGDRITVTTLDGAFRYRVVKTAIVAPYIGAAPKRFIVTAERLPAG